MACWGTKAGEARLSLPGADAVFLYKRRAASKSTRPPLRTRVLLTLRPSDRCLRQSP